MKARLSLTVAIWLLAGAAHSAADGAEPVPLPGPGATLPATTPPAMAPAKLPLGVPASGSATAAVPVAPAPSADWSAIAKWPELMGGVWTNDVALGGADSAHPAAPKFREGVAAVASSNAAACEPRGVPLDIGGAFFFTKDAIFLMTDLDYFVVRRIDMVRREHGEPELTYYGDSLGRWDGRTLVVDTTGFLPQVQIAEGYAGNSKTHVTERFKMTSTDRIELEITVTNPALLQEPWTTMRVLTRHPEWTLHETYCITRQQS